MWCAPMVWSSLMTPTSNVCVLCVVYLLLVSHGALSSHHNLASGLCLELFGRQSTRAQDPAHEVKLHKRKKHMTVFKKRKNSHSQTVFLQCVCVCVCVCVFACAACQCLCICDVLLRETQIAHYTGAGGVLLTLSVSKTEWLTRQLPLCECLCVRLCSFPHHDVSNVCLSQHLFSLFRLL